MAIAKSKINKIKYIEYKDFVEGIMPDGKSFYIDIEDYDIVKENCTEVYEDYGEDMMEKLLRQRR